MVKIKAQRKLNCKNNLAIKLGLIGITIFIILTIIAIITYPNYNFYEQYLSELGIGNTAITFNLGIIISGLLLIPLFVFHYKPKEFFAQLICFIGTASMIFFIGVGVFPLTNSRAHMFTAGLFFILITMTIIIALIEFIKSKNLIKINYATKLFFILICALATVITIIYLIIETPAWQKLAFITIGIFSISWMLINLVRTRK